MENKKSILLIDDDPTLVDLTKELLSVFGVSVLSAEDMEQAIDVYKNDQENIWLIIFDMNLEYNTGIEVFNELKKIDDNFISILSSGMITDSDIDEYKSMGFNEIIPKPYSFKDLHKIIMSYKQQA